MIGNKANVAPAYTERPPWVKVTASVAALALAASSVACTREAQALPGERLAVISVTTVPKSLGVRLLAQVTAGPPALVQKFSSGAQEKMGPSPQEESLSYKPGFGTQFYVQGFLQHAPKPGTEVTLRCQVFADHQEMKDAADEIIVDDANKQTAHVLCAFNENLAPPLPQGK